MNVALILKNRRGRRQSPRLSLFPFLAVLICTMGALVPVLFSVMRQARLQAVREAAAKAGTRHADLKADREMVEWRVEQLKTSRQETQSQLAEARATLAHLEDHSRRLRERLGQLRQACKGLDDAGAEVVRRRGGTQEELARLLAQAVEAERRLADVRRQAKDRPRSYAVVPYQGPNETHRRPIYLECRADVIILQPEGIRLTDGDFEAMAQAEGRLAALLRNHNPLAVAVRAASDYLVSQGSAEGEPYPLLLIRPKGIAAYYAARAAMQSWGSEFGYELIGDDWQLQFPPPDPRLAQVVRQAVEQARAEQVQLVDAAPGPQRGRSKPVYRAASAGGIMREGGGSGDDDSNYRPGTTGTRYGNRFGGSGSERRGGGSGGSGGTGVAGGTGNAAGGRGVSANGQEGTYTGQLGSGGGMPGTGSGGGIPGTGSGGGIPGTGSGGGIPGTGSGGGGPSGLADGSPAGIGGLYGTPGDSSAMGPGTSPSGSGGSVGRIGNPSYDGAATPGGRTGAPSADRPSAKPPEGYVAGRPYEEPPVRREPPASRGEGTPLRPGEWHPREEFAPPPRHDEDDDKRDRHGRKDMKSLAEKRGIDWGLRDAAHGSVAIARPIRVECHADRLVLPGGKTIPLDGRTERAVDRFTSAVWEHMDSWGIAGKGMYWRPILEVSVAPGGEQRFEELKTLMEGSGLTFSRK